VKSSEILIQNKGRISSETNAKGEAGSVNLEAETLAIKNGASISSASLTENSSGKTGNVTVSVNKLELIDQGKISIENKAEVSDTNLAQTIKAGKITITATDVEMLNSEISSDSTGTVAAGGITLNFSGDLRMNQSFIKTTANTGNGGDIKVMGRDLIDLDDSGFLTSVRGEKSNGGNIRVTAKTLIMETGVIQANAKGGSGGDVDLNLQSLIASGNLLTLGGKQVNWKPFEFGLNIIQAASDSGVSGNINVTAPEIDISGAISALDTRALVKLDVNNNPCTGNSNNASSLSRKGKGGLPSNEKNSFSPTSAPSSIPSISVSSADKEGNVFVPIQLALNSKKSPCSSL
jgi:hypothetical protein